MSTSRFLPPGIGRRDEPAPERPYDAEDAAEYLGISIRSLRRAMAARLIAFSKPPFGNVSFSRRDLDEALAAWHREAGEPQEARRRRRLQLVQDEAALVEAAKRRVDARRAARGKAR